MTQIIASFLGCFSGTTRVYREDVSVIMMRDVRIGDRLLTAESTYSPVVAFLDRKESGATVNYLRILTDHSVLEITPTHWVLMRRENDFDLPTYIQSFKLRPGDSVFVLDNNSSGTIKEMRVIRIDGSIKLSDAYAPLTMAGTLIVDDILVSCYAEYEYHSLIHLIMLPFRLWYSVINYSYETQTFTPTLDSWSKPLNFSMHWLL